VRELDKPAGHACTHIDKLRGGCRIYAERPGACRSFDCLWLLSQARPGQQMPPELRPDRAHVVFAMDATVVPAEDIDDQNRELFAWVDPAHPRAWQAYWPSTAIRSFHRRGGTVHITIGDQQILIRPDGEIIVGSEAERALAVSFVRAMMGPAGDFPAPTFDADELINRTTLK
jgi:hypothetical protein